MHTIRTKRTASMLDRVLPRNLRRYLNVLLSLLALPTDNGVGGHGTNLDQVIIANAATSAADQVSGVAVGPGQGGSEDDQSNTISLSMDDLMQYAQPVPDNVITEENGLEDKIAGGSATTKFVTLGMMVS